MEKNLLLLIFLTTLSYSDAEFIFSYELRTKNSQAQSEKIYISKAMSATPHSSLKQICTLKKDDKIVSKLKFLRKNRYKLLECFQKFPKYINSYYKSDLTHSFSQITLKSSPIRFTVKFNNDFAIISTFKK